MISKSIRAKIGKRVRRVAEAFGLETGGPTKVLTGPPEGSVPVDEAGERKALPSRPILPHQHPLLEMASIQYPGTWVKGFQGLRVFGPSVSVVDANGSLLADVSVEWGRKPMENWTFRRMVPPKTEFLPGRTLVLASTGGETYFHWMTDVLPRIRLARKSGYDPLGFDRILVNSLDQPFQKETLALWGITPERCQVLPDREHAFVLQEAVLPSLPGVPGVVSTESVDFLRSALASPVSPEKKRIFIGRKDARHRALNHEAEIFSGLAERGFESVDCAGLSVREQADLFSSAEIVVGAHGAALTNLVFCRPGTRVVELFSPRYVNPCYRDLCAASGLRHAAVIGDGEDWILSTKHNHPSALITASWELVEEALRKLNC